MDSPLVVVVLLAFAAAVANVIVAHCGRTCEGVFSWLFKRRSRLPVFPSFTPTIIAIPDKHIDPFKFFYYSVDCCVMPIFVGIHRTQTILPLSTLRAMDPPNHS